jgi:hypothetical protein
MRGALGVALAIAVAIAGCGGGDTKTKNEYVQQVNQAQSDFVAIVDDSEAKIQNDASDKQTAIQLDMIRAAAAKVVVKLRAIKPPSKVEKLHGTLVQEAQGLVAAFRKAADAYGSSDPAKILQAKVDLGNDINRVNGQLNATITQLNNELH